MSNALNRAERYHDLAEECRCLAASTLSTQMSSRYLRMAEIYIALAEAEETRSASLRRLAAPVSSQKCIVANRVPTDGVSRALHTIRARMPGRCLLPTVDEPHGSLA
jgi:hypothetical protein